MSSKPKPVECPNNEGVACTHPNRCGTCGWNPEVAAIREADRLKAAPHKAELPLGG